MVVVVTVVVVVESVCGGDWIVVMTVALVVVGRQWRCCSDCGWGELTVAVCV